VSRSRPDHIVDHLDREHLDRLVGWEVQRPPGAQVKARPVAGALDRAVGLVKFAAGEWRVLVRAAILDREQLSGAVEHHELDAGGCDHAPLAGAIHNEIPLGYQKRDGQVTAWALSNSLSREDMAIATGLAKSRVDRSSARTTSLRARARSRHSWRVVTGQTRLSDPPLALNGCFGPRRR
jgi:hypothetical protein